MNEPASTDQRVSLQPGVSAPLILYPRLPMHYLNIAGMTGVLLLLAAYFYVFLEGHFRVFWFPAIVLGNSVVAATMQVLCSRISLTATHLDLLVFGRRRELVRWEDILEIREVMVPRHWYNFLQSDFYSVKTARGIYRLPKSMWPDAEWIIINYRNQTGREIKQVNYW